MTNETPPQMAVTVEQLFRRRVDELDERADGATGSNEADDAYNIGLRDGVEEAVQWLDEMTGGDGEYFASTLPGEGCPGPVDMAERIVARLTQQSAATGGEVPSGFVLVPREPTQDMVKEGWASMGAGPDDPTEGDAWNCYEAMLDAALEPTHPNDMARENAEPARGGALDGYRAAVSWISADSWDGCSECIDILKAARASDVDWDWAGDHDRIAAELKRIRHFYGSTTPSNPPGGSDGVLREQVARVIDPEAFDQDDGSHVTWLLQEQALAKADAILALTNPAGDAEAIEAVVGRMSLDEQVSALDLIQKKCTCFEVNGEDPDCLLHGEDTDWGRANPDIADDAALSANGGDAG